MPRKVPTEDRAVRKGETYFDWLERLDKPDSYYWRSWYEQDKQSRGLMDATEEHDYLDRQGWNERRRRRRRQGRSGIRRFWHWLTGR